MNRLGLVAASLATSLCLVEACLSVTNADTRALKNMLYLMERYSSTKEIHRASPDPDLLYETIPETSAVAKYHVHRLETKYQHVRIHINRLGFRGPERTAKKKPGVFRIVVFGGSNTWGPTVSDEDTCPAQLERLLNDRAPGRFEVWNAGVNAYVLSQEVAYARRVAALYAPDLLIFQVGNRGRRAFMHDDHDFPELFAKNPELYEENVPWIFSDDGRHRAVHGRLVRRWRGYRLLVNELNRLFVRRRLGGNVQRMQVKQPENDRQRGLVFELFSRYGDGVSDRLFRAFLREKTPPVVLFEPKDRGFGRSYNRLTATHPRFSYITLGEAARSKPPEYSEGHPPSHVYAWYAEELLRGLTARGLIPLSR